MRLSPLYTVRFFYPKDQTVEIKNPEDANAAGREEEMFFFAEGTSEGRISGRFKGANTPNGQTGRAYRPAGLGVPLGP